MRGAGIRSGGGGCGWTGYNYYAVCGILFSEVGSKIAQKWAKLPFSSSSSQGFLQARFGGRLPPPKKKNQLLPLQNFY